MFAPLRRASLQRVGLVVAGLALVTLPACKVSTELGTPCLLVRRPGPQEAGADVRSVPVTYGEIPRLVTEDGQRGTDYVSFGAVECDDLICVLDADASLDGKDPAAQAQGYCTQACVEGESTCEVTAPDVPAELVQRMTCRGLILDDQTLKLLREQQPDFYRRSFGENSSSAFCAGARLSATDAP